ncbi:MAG: zinc ribbon domain-containing protein [Sandaracinaceae bacterium]|nr:zinc ribbon domain-containing protein [Sandaracinaceae bacterium]
MYSWDDDISDWYNPSAYEFDETTKDERAKEAAKAKAAGPRTYATKKQPELALVDPKKHLRSDSPNPVLVAVDVTGSMQSWPAKIFDRLPLLYNTLAQYRSDLEVCFAAIGDAAADRYPLQVTSFAKGYDLEKQLGALYGEGGGGDAPESYGLFAHFVDTHVEAPNARKPWLIVFGDAPMHDHVPASQIGYYLGDSVPGDVDAIKAWQSVAERWNVWFLRRPGGQPLDAIDVQWGRAVGTQKIVHIDDEERAVDYAMGLIARAWGHFGDFQDNMRARQPDERVDAVSKKIEAALKAKPSELPPPPPPETATLSCHACGHLFEASDPRDKQMCPKCGATVEV